MGPRVLMAVATLMPLAGACSSESTNPQGADSGAAPATGGASVEVAAGVGGAGVATGGASVGGSPPSTGSATAIGTGGVTPSTGGTTAAVGTGGSVGAGKGGATPSTGGTTVAVGTGGSVGAGTGGAATGGASSAGASSAGSGAGGSASSTCEVFSFFETSLEAMRRESGSSDGFGGDLGGLAGADALCRTIAEDSLPCAGQKEWRAFLSTSTEDAIDRVGSGPWYDRVGRLVANTVTDLANTRPANADPEIAEDLPNEYGVPNHSPDGTIVDNHDVLTGSDEQGRLAGSDATCNDWTSTDANLGRPMIGHSWPARSGEHWISSHNAGGCVPGVNLGDTGGGASGTVGAMGGYGAIYCFALTP